MGTTTTEKSHGTGNYMSIRDTRTQHFCIIQLAISLTFVLYSLFLFRLPTIWDTNAKGTDHAQLTLNLTNYAGLALDLPSSPVNSTEMIDSRKDFTSKPLKVLAIDVWFALVFTTSLDAATTVASFNRSIIDNWHYFISVRMMALGSMISFTVFLCGQSAANHRYLHLIAALFGIGAIHKLLGLILGATHKAPPTINVVPRRWTLQEYTIALSRFPSPWGLALFATAMTGGLGTVLTMIVPPSWSSMIPILTTAFEAVYLRLNKFGRSPQYTVCAAPIFQAGVCVHWGLRQVTNAPRLLLPAWVFVLLLLLGRLILDVHLRTIYRIYPEFQWARKHALVSTRHLILFGFLFLLLEAWSVPVMTWIKPITVFCFYFLSTSGVSAPAAYIIAFGMEKKIK